VREVLLSSKDLRKMLLVLTPKEMKTQVNSEMKTVVIMTKRLHLRMEIKFSERSLDGVSRIRT